jgi:hypothetical protein
MTTARIFVWFAVTAALSLAACAHRVTGQPYAAWELRGAIVDAAGNRLRVRHKTGQIVDVVLDDATTVTRDGKPAGRDGLRSGVRVRITVEPMEGGGQRAQLVQLYGGG